MSWIDAHTHLDSDPLHSQLQQVLDRASNAEVATMLLVNSEATVESFTRTLDCLEAPHQIERFVSLGVHPHNATQWDSALEKQLDDLLRRKGVIALGEIGLDYYYNFSPPETQRAVLRAQLQKALDFNLPVVIHCRDAYPELAQILSEWKILWRGMIHCFTGTREEAEMLMQLGFYISFSGIVTFRTANTLREAARSVPRDRILTETDAPYLAPVPYRGKTNEPAYVAQTARFLAALRGQNENELADDVRRNFRALFLTAKPRS